MFLQLLLDACEITRT